MLANIEAEVAAMMGLYTYIIFFLLYESKEIECHVYISRDAPCFPATLTAAIWQFNASDMPFKDIESHVQFPCASHSYSSNSMLGKNDTEVAAIVHVYTILLLS